MTEQSLEQRWLDMFKGKTLKSVRTKYTDESRIPAVVVSFIDDSAFEISVLDGVYFEGCLINILRKAHEVDEVMVVVDENETYIEVRAKTFPMFILLAQNMQIPAGDFPFEVKELAHG